MTPPTRRRTARRSGERPIARASPKNTSRGSAGSQPQSRNGSTQVRCGTRDDGRTRPGEVLQALHADPHAEAGRDEPPRRARRAVGDPGPAAHAAVEPRRQLVSVRQGIDLVPTPRVIVTRSAGARCANPRLTDPPTPGSLGRTRRAPAAEEGRAKPMQNRGPLPVIGAAIVLVLVLVGGGTALGFGPLAGTTPPSEVTDPKEMVARSLQSVIDAQAVHLEGTLSGTIPGRARRTRRGRRRARRLHRRRRPAPEGREDVHPARRAPGSTWTWPRSRLGRRLVPHRSRRSLAARVAGRRVAAGAGVDINPLSLVDRLRSYLASPGIAPTLEDVAVRVGERAAATA